MKRKILCFILCLVSVAGFVPASAFATNDIDKVELCVEAPYGGLEAVFDAEGPAPTECGYRVDTKEVSESYYGAAVWWKDETTGKDLVPGDKFITGHSYTVEIRVKTYYSGITFDYRNYYNAGVTHYYYKTEAYVNGSQGVATKDSDKYLHPYNYMRAKYTFENIPAAPAPIDAVEVFGVNMPVAGMTPDNLADIGKGNYKLCSDVYLYKPAGVAWQNEKGGYISNDTFKEGQKYTVSVMLEAVHPYRFKTSGDTLSVNGTLNGKKANVSYYNGSDYPADRYCLVKYTFPATESAVSFVEVEIDTPKLGANPDYTPTLGDGYSVFDGVVWWYKDGDFMAAGEKFESGHNYSLQIWLKADVGFAVDKNYDTAVSGTLNGKVAKIDTAYEQEASQVIALRYDFGKAENHSLSYVPMTDSTCTDTGKQAYYKCSCGEYYEDAAGTRRITNFETWGVIPALGHCPTEIIPDGDEHWAKCSRCKEEIPGTREAHFGGNEQADGSYICEWCGAEYGGKELKPIAYIALEIKEPVAGIEANFVAADKSSGAEGAVGYDFYSPTPVKWYDKTAGQYLAVGDRFVKGHVYRIEIYMYAEDGYTFPLYEGQPNVLANLNWLDAKVMSVYGLSPDKFIALSYEFPALGEHEHVYLLKNDGDYHWQECRDCGHTQGREKHKGDMQNVCTECGYQMSGAPTVDDSYIFPFTDVAESAWYYQWIKGAHEMGLINGKTSTTYCPKDNMTYAEAIKLAACMHQLYHEGKVSLENGKIDWRTSYYDYCRDKGIIRATANAAEPGYDELFTLASQPIDRQTYVYLFSRALPAEAFKEINIIPDNSIPDVAVNQGIWDDGIYLFYRAGILNGTDAKGTFNPTGNIQRSEVAAILNRMIDESVRVGAPAQLGK